jgi:preprotein translocase subunit SecA
MSIITLGDFALTNADGNSTFSFKVPSTKTIDYVKEINDALPKPGRNEHCPCGSGKKYKNCCGA